jgi:type IV secretory pathway TrbD component
MAFLKGQPVNAASLRNVVMYINLLFVVILFVITLWLIHFGLYSIKVFAERSNMFSSVNERHLSIALLNLNVLRLQNV